ncbi:MAG: alpha-L-rhamnosidase N-terminal domain-containing protein, partial [Bacteroidaceae bacterium]|nr:alpha-L-rhamnosidase N-terminal domain-containing protein [Bacteroidaceae bacterium]
MHLRHIITLLLALVVYGCSRGRTHVYDLTCEGMENPLGIDNTEPHFSWKLISGKPARQVAYEILVASRKELLKPGKADLWDSGQTSSDASVMVPYGGKALQSRQLCFWKVRVWTEDGPTGWSAVQRFAVGIQGGDQMQGQYIGLGIGQDKAIFLTRTYNINKVGQAAFLHVNSLGYHEVYLNGKRVSDAPLAPAVSQMDKRSLIVTYDVTKFLKKGENQLLLWIGSGWYKRDTFRATFDGPAVKAELDMLEDGTWKPIVQTDGQWQAAESGYYDTGRWLPWQFEGERIDARLVPTDFSPKGLAALDWQPAKTAHIEGIEATPQMCQLNTVKETINSAAITSLGGDRWLVDMGKAFNGQFE